MASSKLAKEIMELGPEAFNSFKKLLGMGVNPQQAAGVIKSQSQEVARQARATEGGFNTKEVWYHGTSDKITEFDPTKLGSRDHGFLGKGVYITPNEGVAKAYSKTAKGGSNPQVLQLHTSANNPFQITLEQKKMLQSGGPKEAERFQQWVLDNGYDSAEVVTPSGEILERVVYNPTQLRAPNAQFKDLKSGKLLAGVTGAAVLGGQTEDAEAGILNVKGFSDEVGRLLEVGLLTPQSRNKPTEIKKAANKYNKRLKESRGFAQREDLAAMNDSVTKRTIGTYEDKAKVYTPEELADMGAVIMPVKGDPTFVGSVEQVSGVPLSKELPQQGGHQYPFANPEAWQSQEGIAKRFLNKARTLSDKHGGAPVAAMFSQMGRESSNFSAHPSNIIVDQVQNALDIPKKDIKAFDDMFRAKYPSWVGIKSPDAQDWLNGRGEFLTDPTYSGERRKQFTLQTKLAPFRDAGFPVYNTVIDAVNHPELAGNEVGTAGRSLIFPDLNRDVWVDPSVHMSYDSIIPQDQSIPVGRLANEVSFNDMYPDAVEEMKGMLNTGGKPLDYLQQVNKVADSSLGKTPATGGFQNTTEEWVKKLNKALTNKEVLGLGAAGLLLPTDKAQAAGLSGPQIKAPKSDLVAKVVDYARQAQGAMKGSPAELIYPESLVNWVDNVNYGQPNTAGETLFAGLDVMGTAPARAAKKGAKIVSNEISDLTDFAANAVSQKTQRANTVATAVKANDYLDAISAPKGKTLDYGAGLGENAKAIKADATFEPFPQKGFEPTYTNPADVPANSFERVVSTNVINVLPKNLRDDAILNIGKSLKKGGTALVQTWDLGAIKATSKSKTAKPVSNEQNAYITGTGTFQKGFSGPELKNYVEEVLGDLYKVEIVPNKANLSGVAVTITKQ